MHRLFQWFRSSGVILLYHRVAPVRTDPQLLAVLPEVFEAHVEMLKRKATVLSLSEMVRAASSGRMPRRAVSITFDDGYVDNLRYAKPVLERQGASAIVFAVSGAARRQTEFWWDTLERALLKSAGPATVELAIGGRAERWALDGDAERFPAWNVLDQENPTARHKAYREIALRVKPLAPAQRERVLGELLRQLRLAEQPQNDCRPMNPAELAEIAAGGAVEIGSHSVSHPRLSELSLEEQAEQVRASKSELEAILGSRVKSFAYPYGSKDDYSPDTARLVREAGYESACANFPGLVRRGTDPMELPRVLVRNISAPVLEQQLAAHMRDGG